MLTVQNITSVQKDQTRFRKLGTVRGCKNMQTTKKKKNTAPGGLGGDTP